jgi:hypothetical protein
METSFSYGQKTTLTHARHKRGVHSIAYGEAACDAWNKLISQPQTITSIGIRDWHMSVNDFWDWY